MGKYNSIKDKKQQKELLFLYQSFQRRQDREAEPTLNLSIELAKEIYRLKLITPFTTYLAVKFIARVGYINISDAIRLAADTLGHKDTRSVNKAIKQCLDLNWLGTDGKLYFIRGFHHLERQFDIDSRKAGLLKFSELKNIREWILSYSLGRRFKDYTSVNKARTGQRYKRLENAKQVSITIISRELGLSRAASCELKQRAAKLGYFRYYNPIEQTGIDPDDLHHARKMLDDPALFIHDGSVIRKLPSRFEFNVTTAGSLRLLHFKKRNNHAA